MCLSCWQVVGWSTCVVCSLRPDAFQMLMGLRGGTTERGSVPLQKACLLPYHMFLGPRTEAALACSPARGQRARAYFFCSPHGRFSMSRAISFPACHRLAPLPLSLSAFASRGMYRSHAHTLYAALRFVRVAGRVSFA